MTTPTISSTPPEPLSILTALESLKGIRLIFDEQRKFYKRLQPIVISCPFSMLDTEGLKKDVFKALAVDKMAATLKLREIHQLAEGNIQFYEKRIQGKEYDSPEPWEVSYLYYSDSAVGAGFRSADGLPMAERIVRHPDNRQTKTYPLLFLFYDFCLTVRKLTNSYLTEQAKPDQLDIPLKTAPPPKDKDQPTAPQIALFFYYLGISRNIPHPGRKFFVLDEKHKQPPYNFPLSGQKVYLFYNILSGSRSKKITIDNVMTVKNLKAVIPMLKKFPIAQQKANNDLYSKGITP